MAFGASYKDIQGEFRMLPEGKYHAVLATYAIKRLGNIPCIDLSYKVTDHEMFNGHTVSRLIWEKKPENQSAEDMETGGFSYKQLMQVGKAARVPEGGSYDSVEQFLEQCINVPVEIEVEHQNRNGKTYEGVKFVNPVQSGTPAAQTDPTRDFEEVIANGDDLPF